MLEINWSVVVPCIFTLLVMAAALYTVWARTKALRKEAEAYALESRANLNQSTLALQETRELIDSVRKTDPEGYPVFAEMAVVTGDDEPVSGVRRSDR